jgi:short-subunit dehydrogenase
VQIQGTRALVTGAAGGIGSAIARRLRSEGAELVISGRRREPLDELAGQIGATVITADLAVRSELHELVDGAGEVDILVANAALPAAGRLESFSEQEIDRALEVNLHAPIILAQSLLPGMRSRGRGQIVFISSLSGKVSSTRTGIYNASKFGLRGFAGALRADLHGTGIGVSAIFPGFISEAGMFVESGGDLPAGVSTRSPEQVAAAVSKAVQRDLAEIDVAPISLRAGAWFANFAPDTAAALSRKMGADELSRTMEEGHAERR